MATVLKLYDALLKTAFYQGRVEQRLVEEEETKVLCVSDQGYIHMITQLGNFNLFLFLTLVPI